MAFMRVNFISESLRRKVTMNAIVPVDKMMPPGAPKPEKKPFKTLYLLHGIFGNYQDWVIGTRIERWANEYNLAVIMPSGENGFYVDHPIRGDMKYGEFIGKDLVQFTRDLFPLSDKREDTFIAGLSMGGYGAIRNGLKYAETFGYIGAFSSALILENAKKSTDDAPSFMGQRSYYESMFGDLDKLDGSDNDYKGLVLNLKKNGKPIPKMYMSCGTEDFLLEANRDYRDFLNEQGVDLTYEEGPGGHDWDFWDTYIKKFIDWLPLEKDVEVGLHSGRVQRD
ncbi:MAG: alpha/beta hydrolase [Clostridia bacterium]|jgi:putative tributyrin esterase